MKYVILIHSNPEPWGHPTQQLTAEGRALSAEKHAEMDREFEALLTEISAVRRAGQRGGPGRPGVVDAVRLEPGRATWPPTVRTPRPRSSWPASS